MKIIALDIGGTAVKLGIVDETGAVGPKAEESVNFDGYQTPPQRAGRLLWHWPKS